MHYSGEESANRWYELSSTSGLRRILEGKEYRSLEGEVPLAVALFNRSMKSESNTNMKRVVTGYNAFFGM